MYEGVQPYDVAVGQPAYQVVINDPEPAGIQVQTEGSSVRRYSIVTKGITSRYKDFVEMIVMMLLCLPR